MNLFEAIPANLFSIFNSKNREIYVNTLFALRQSFKQELSIEKELLIQQLATSLHQELLNLDVDEEENNDGKKISKDSMSLSRFIIKRLAETGWIEFEYGVDTSFKEYITLSPYSIKIINTLYGIALEDEQGYNTYMYSIYSNLMQADAERKDFMYAALLNAYDRTQELENELKTLYHNIRRKYNKLGFLMNVNDVLVDHFDDYQRKIIAQIYMPLKTKDSLNRFKGSVVQVLLKWLRDSETLESLQKQAMTYQSFNSFDDVKESIITKIYFIVDKLNELEEMVDKIDAKNTEYVSATADKMRTLLTNDKSIKAKMTRLMELLKDSNTDNTQDEVLENFYPNIALESTSYLDDTSLFVRSYYAPDLHSEPLYIDDTYDASIDVQASDFIENMNNTYSNKNVIAFVEKKLENKNELDSSKFKITTDQELILTIHSMLKGWDKNVFYRIELGEGNVNGETYSIPKMTYYRRRKI